MNRSPKAPKAKKWRDRRVGKNKAQNKLAQLDAAEAEANGATDIRIDQEQVNAKGERVGRNRPDLQYTARDGVRHHVEYDTPESGRGPGHQDRIEANGPDAKATPTTHQAKGQASTTDNGNHGSQ